MPHVFPSPSLLTDFTVKPTRNASNRWWPLAAAILLQATALLVGLSQAPWHVVVRLVLLAPWLEETVFRRGLQDRLQSSRLSQYAPLIVALGFAAAHVMALIAVGLFTQQTPTLASLLFALSTVAPAWWIGRDYQKYRSLPRSAILHSAFNTVWLIAFSPSALSPSS